MQKPVSSPTAKQLASWLKEADKAIGLLDVSITGRVFIVVAGQLCEQRPKVSWFTCYCRALRILERVELDMLSRGTDS